MNGYAERDARYGAPHCDSSVLHAPSTCRFCDMYPDRQAMRTRARINFTGEYDLDKAPCPSTYFRPVQVRDRWGGNRAVPHGEDPPPMANWGSLPPPAGPPGPRSWWDRLLDHRWGIDERGRVMG